MFHYHVMIQKHLSDYLNFYNPCLSAFICQKNSEQSVRPSSLRFDFGFLYLRSTDCSLRDFHSVQGGGDDPACVAGTFSAREKPGNFRVYKGFRIAWDA